MRPGETIDGRFEILRPVRSGGLSVVFEGADRRSGDRVAVKIINVQPSEDALLRRIEREIRILSALSHPHVVGCLGSGMLGDGRPYLILEWLEGEDLADFKLRAPLTLRRVLEVAGQVADALSAAHTLGIIHRDIKPSNIYLVKPAVNARLDCRVIDFGVAKMPQSNAGITRAGAILGTPSYMAPEQASDAMDVDARADVFSLGVVTFELLTGRLPWHAATDLARLARILVEPAMRVKDVSPDVPKSVAELIDAMLMLRPSDRVPQVRVVHDRVVAALTELPEGILDTTFTRDEEMLRSFTREETAALPIQRPPSIPPVHVSDVRRGEARRGDSGRKDMSAFDLESTIGLAAISPPTSSPEVHRGRSARGRSGVTQAVSASDVSGLRSSPKYRKDNSEKTEVVARLRAPTIATEQFPAPKAEDVSPPLLRASSEALLEVAPVAPRGVALIEELPENYDQQPSYVERSNRVLFGRVQEIDSLRSMVLRSLNVERPTFAKVIGVAGIGKTRIRVELTKIIRTVAKPPLVLAGRAEESARSEPFSFVRKLLLREAAIVSDDPPELKRAKLLDIVPPQDVLERMRQDDGPATFSGRPPESVGDASAAADASCDSSADVALRDAFSSSGILPQVGNEERSALCSFLCRGLGIPYPDVAAATEAPGDPLRVRDEISRAFDLVLKYLAQGHGLAIIVDDAHFLDHLSSMVLRNLASPERKLRIILIAFALPNLPAPGLIDVASQSSHVMNLDPLDARASREFVRSLVKGSVEARSLEHLVNRASGNPLYLQQLVRAVQATGVLQVTESGEHELRGLQGDQTDDDRIPPTVAAAVAARMSRMRHDVQRVLAAAAVFGEIFWVQGVSRVLEERVEDTMSLLQQLLDEDMLRMRVGSRYRGQMEMEFSHAVIRSVALARLKRRRRQRFERSALAYLRSVGETSEAVLAAHHAHAADPGTASGLYADAAERSLEIGAVVCAGALADEGLALAEVAGVDPVVRRRILGIVERTAVLGSSFESAAVALDTLFELAASDEERASIRERRGDVSLLCRRFGEARRHAEEAVECWSKVGSDAGVARARVTHAEAFEAMGDGRAALRSFVSAHTVFSELGEAGGLARSAAGLARIAVSSGDYRTAENRFRESLTHAQAVQDARGVFGALLGLAEVARLVGDFPKAAELLADAERGSSRREHALALEIQRACLSAEEERLSDARKSLELVIDATERKAELNPIRRLAVLHLAQLVLTPPESESFRDGREIDLTLVRDQLLVALSSARADQPSLVVGLQMSLALAYAVEGRAEESKSLDAEAVGRFQEEGAVVEDEPPRILLAHARVLEALQAPPEEVRDAWRSAVGHLDSIASRLERKVRARYLARWGSKMIMSSAERVGLKLSRKLSSSRIRAL